MEIPDLFDEVHAQLISFWRKKIEAVDNLNYVKRENEVKEQLNEKLDENIKELAKLYGVAVESRMEHIYYEICRHLFFFGIKAGMEMQKAFDSDR